MNTSHSDKTILITGAYGGIGSATARRLKASGFNLILSGRNKDKLRPLADELNSESIVADTTLPDQVERLIAEAATRDGGLYGMVHSVGSMHLKPAHITTAEEFEEAIKTNLLSALYMLKFGAKAMMTGGGSMVFFSTVATGIGLANHEAIAAAKAGVDGMVISAAASYAGRGIRVNAVAPGLTDTPLAARITSNEASLKASVAMHPLGRIGKTEDIASAAAWLMSPEQSWVTGQILRVDGGMSTVRSRTS